MANNTFSGMAFGALALLFAYQSVTGYMQGTACANWRFTKGVVTSSGTSLDWMRKGYNLYPNVSYSYAVDGRQYTSDRISYPSPGSRSMARANKYLEKYPLNTAVTVYFDPKQPSSASLQNSVNYDDLQSSMVLCAIFGVISFFLFATSGPEKWR